MFVVRYVALAALAVWVGGMAVLGVLDAGAVDGAILRVFRFLAYGCGAAILVCLSVIKLVGPPPRAFKLRAALVSLMLAIAIYSGLGPTRELTGLASGSGPIALRDHDRFELLRIKAIVLMATDMMVGLVLLYWYVRE
jgi:hypothetical protein